MIENIEEIEIEADNLQPEGPKKIKVKHSDGHEGKACLVYDENGLILAYTRKGPRITGTPAYHTMEVGNHGELKQRILALELTVPEGRFKDLQDLYDEPEEP